MKVARTAVVIPATIFAVFCLVLTGGLDAQNTRFHNTPASADQLKNPFAGRTEAIAKGAELYVSKCASCHGPNGQGQGNAPMASTR